jgi:hypothetical protein
MVRAEIMAAIYWRLLKLIWQRAYKVLGEGVRLSRTTKLSTALSVYLGASDCSIDCTPGHAARIVPASTTSRTTKEPEAGRGQK